ncbi:hypothetical protein PT974_01840 [Cladobotryum mycophilum]|uniref:Uncharacterized protein n=1 Tax=Cladobotryum mycophilum TaxID=491253 RepID=A0ABR0SWD9_9HYPO
MMTDLQGQGAQPDASEILTARGDGGLSLEAMYLLEARHFATMDLQERREPQHTEVATLVARMEALVYEFMSTKDTKKLSNEVLDLISDPMYGGDEDIDDHRGDSLGFRMNWAKSTIQMLVHEAATNPANKALDAFGPKATRPAIAYHAAKHGNIFLTSLDYWCRTNNISASQYAVLYRVIMRVKDEGKQVLDVLPSDLDSLNALAKKTPIVEQPPLKKQGTK